MELDRQAIAEYLTLGYTLDWKTLVKGRTYTPKNVQPPTLDLYPDATIADVKNVLEDYFSKFDNKKVAVALSGGKDSRLIAEMCKYLGLDVTAYTFGFRKDSREYKVASRVASRLDIPHLFLELKPDVYSEETVRGMATCSLYGLSASPNAYDYYFKDTLSNFDVVFNGTQLTIAPREQRFYQPAKNIDRIMRTVNFDSIVDKKMRDEVKQNLLHQYRGKTLEEMILQRYKIKMYRRYDTTKELFNLDWPAVAGDVINTMRSIPEVGIVKKVMKQYNFTTYNLPCTRSPFPLWFPWIIHYGYRYLRNFVKPIDAATRSAMGLGGWASYWDVYCKLVKDLAEKLNLPDSLDFEFIDKDAVNQKLSAADRRKDYAQSLKKIIKFKLWLEAIP